MQTGDIALMHTRWKMSGAEPRTSQAIEVARCQAEGTWRWLAGDPFTVSREADL